MRSEEEIKTRINEWEKTKFSDFEQNPVGTAICELRWVLGAEFDILAENKRAREFLPRLKSRVI